MNRKLFSDSDIYSCLNNGDFSDVETSSECSSISVDDAIDDMENQDFDFNSFDFNSFDWQTGVNHQPTSFSFNSNAGIRSDSEIKSSSRESCYFEYFFDSNIMEEISRETNRYESFKSRKEPFSPFSRAIRWTETTIREMYVFIALTLLMNFARKHSVEDYWKKESLVPTPIFGQFMSRNRYSVIMRFLHFSDSEFTGMKGPLYKLGNVFKYLCDRFKNVFQPFQKLCIDESLVLFKGRLSFKQYIPNKRNRFGLKLFVLCDCTTGMVLDMILYTGLSTEINRGDQLGVSGAVVKKLMERYLGRGHILYADNWYSSPALCSFLASKNTGYCGTVRSNRKNMPRFEKTKQDDIHLKKSGQTLVIKWHDKREIHIITSVHNGELIETPKINRKTNQLIKKPKAVLDYNINMRLVDKSDMLISSVSCMRKRIKWYIKLFFHLVDIAMLNAFILHCHNSREKSPYKDFVYNVIQQLLEDYGNGTSANPEGEPIAMDVDEDDSFIERIKCKEYMSRHYITTILTNGKPNSGSCFVCKNTKKKPRCRKRIVYECNECKVPLCLRPCFMEYHSMKEF